MQANMYFFLLKGVSQNSVNRINVKIKCLLYAWMVIAKKKITEEFELLSCHYKNHIIFLNVEKSWN